EVRGFPRPKRGDLLPIAVRGERATLRYLGLDGIERWTHAAFADGVDVGPAMLVDGGEGAPTQASIVARWGLRTPAGGRRVIEWRIWASERPAGTKRVADSTNGARPTKASDIAALFPDPPSVTADQGAAAYRAWTSSSTAVDTDNQLFSASIHRSLADLRLLLNDGPSAGERYVSAGVPWF